MHVRFDNEMKKKVMVYSFSLIIAITIGIVIYNCGTIIKGIKTFASAAAPFIVGLGLAIVLRIPVSWLEKSLFKNFKKKRLWSALVVFLIFIFLLILMISMILPNLISSIQQLLTNQKMFQKNIRFYIKQIEQNMHIDLSNTESYLTGRLSKLISENLSKIATYSVAAVRFLINTILAIVSAFYIVLDKESLCLTFKRLTYAIFPESIANHLVHFTHTTRDVFDSFIIGNLIDSLIIGIICYIGISIFRLPYAQMIAFIVGITNLIPVFGPFLGAIPSAILLVLINPIYALIFLIFIFILQQFDGNILKPLVLGDQLGLSGFWILFSVTVGGSLYGVIGMFLGVPVFALIYRTLQEYTENKLNEKRLEP